MQSFSGSLPMMLYSTLDAVMPRFRKIFKKFGLTEQQWRILRVLWEIDSVALQTLAEITLIPAPSLVGVIDRLETSNLVERRRSKSDRRVVYIHATSTGQKLERKVRPEVDRLYAELQASIDPKVWDSLIKGLDIIIATCGSEKAENRAGDK
jgi:homoprotocatechuate degradation regulator HpaR